MLFFLRVILLHKTITFILLSPVVINGEKATLETPTFAQKRQRTLDMLIRSLYQDLMPDMHKVWTHNLEQCNSVLNQGAKGVLGGLKLIWNYLR